MLIVFLLLFFLLLPPSLSFSVSLPPTLSPSVPFPQFCSTPPSPYIPPPMTTLSSSTTNDYLVNQSTHFVCNAVVSFSFISVSSLLHIML